MNTPAEIVTVQGGYRVRLGQSVHLVNKQRQCSCAREDCPAIRLVAAYLRAGGQRAPELRVSRAACPLCGEPIIGSLEQGRWVCTASRDHYYAWRGSRLRASRAECLDWLRAHAPYRYDLARFFLDASARAEFLDTHTLPYPAGA